MSLVSWERAALRVGILLAASFGILWIIDGDMPLPAEVFTALSGGIAAFFLIVIPVLTGLRVAQETPPTDRFIPRAVRALPSLLTRAWSPVEDPPTRAGLFVARLLLVAAAIVVLIYTGPLSAPDLRFQPGVAEHDLEDPQFVLAVFILAPTVLGLLAATFFVRLTFISAVVVLCLGSMEGAAVLYHRLVVPGASPLVVKSEGDGIWNPVCGRMGLCLNPNTRVRQVGMVGDKAIYDAVYEADEAGSRRSLPKEDTRLRSNFIAFFGDSNTFGMTVNGPETLPGQVAKLACDYQPYNFAVEGGGMNNMLGAFDMGKIESGVKQKEGYFIYVFNEGHLLRNIPNSQSILWSKQFPAYEVDASGALTYRGTLWTYRPFRNAISTLVDRLDALSALHVRYPFFVTKSENDLGAAILSRAYDLSQQQFPNSKFVVLLATREAKPATDALLQSLKGMPIRVLDYSGLAPVEMEGSRTPYDRHPSALYHRIFAEHLAADLGIESACPE